MDELSKDKSALQLDNKKIKMKRVNISCFSKQKRTVDLVKEMESIEV